MKKDIKNFGFVGYLELLSKLIAFSICIGLLAASLVTIFFAFKDLYALDVDLAIQDGLFVLILLEMFYVTRSFIKYGSINVSLVVNVGIIAAVKEMVFRLDRLDWQIALAFGVLFLTLSVVYVAEMINYSKK